jgi:hypothetical protein
MPEEIGGYQAAIKQYKFIFFRVLGTPPQTADFIGMELAITNVSGASCARDYNLEISDFRVLERRTQ